MPKLPVVKDKELIKAIKKIGFYEHRQRGASHLIMAHSDGRRASIPIHPGKDIPKGTLRGILKGLEISVEEFILASEDDASRIAGHIVRAKTKYRVFNTPSRLAGLRLGMSLIRVSRICGTLGFNTLY